MATFRKIAFSIMILIYAISCPWLIFYSLGYIYRPGEESGIVKTGLIYLSTTPAGATIHLGNKRFTKKTPAMIRNLLPGSYDIKLSRKKYQSWTQTLPVETNKATVMDKILLLPQTWGQEKVAAGPFENLLPISKTPYLLLSKSSRAKDLYLYNWKEGTGRFLFSESSAIQNDTVLATFAVEQSHSFLLETRSDTREKYLMVEIKNRKLAISDLTNLFLEKPENLAWDPKEKDYLLTYQNSHLNRLNIASYEVHPKFQENIFGYGVLDKELYILKKTGGLRRMEIAQEKAGRIFYLDDPVLLHFLQETGSFFTIKPFNRDLILFMGENGSLLTNLFPYLLAEKGVRGLDLNNSKEEALVWEKQKLGIVDFPEKQKGIIKTERKARLKWLFDEGSDIRRAFWVYENAYILFLDHNAVWLLEIETYDRPRPVRLADVLEGSSIFYGEDSGKVYYLEPKTGNLCSLEVLPKRELLFFPSPEIREEKKAMRTEDDGV